MRRTALLLACAAMLGAACAGTTSQGPQAPPPQQHAGVTSVQALIGDAACESDSQCATIGIGAKACGGPAAYLAWSRLRTDPAALQAAAQQQAAEQVRANSAAGRMSTCSVVPDPGAWCEPREQRTGVCRLRSSQGMPPAPGPTVR